MRRTGLLLATGIALLATACGGGTTRRPPSTTTSTSTSTSTSTTSTPPPTTTTSAPHAPTCLVSQLAAELTPPDAGAGQRYSRLIFTNNGSTDCSMLGYPGFQLLGPGSTPLPTNVLRNTDRASLLVTLPASGGHAFTAIHWGVIASAPGDSGTDPCQPEATQIQITPPNETHSLFQPWTFGPVCGEGTLGVDPMMPGVGA